MAMMLQIDHRESHDIDIFLADAQLLSFLDPKLSDLEFETSPSDYTSDGSSFLKLAFDGVGEIDFVVGYPMTDVPTVKRIVEGEEVYLETVAEIITKKIYYRGASIKPRDIFDIAAAVRHHRVEMVDPLRAYKDDVAKTLTALERLNPDFVNAAIAALAIRDPYKPTVGTAFEDARNLLRSI